MAQHAVSQDAVEFGFQKTSQTAGITRDSVIRKNRKTGEWTTGRRGPWSFRLGVAGHRVWPGTRGCQGERTTGRHGAWSFGLLSFIARRVIHCDAGSARYFFTRRFCISRANYCFVCFLRKSFNPYCLNGTSSHVKEPGYTASKLRSILLNIPLPRLIDKDSGS